MEDRHSKEIGEAIATRPPRAIVGPVCASWPISPTFNTNRIQPGSPRNPIELGVFRTGRDRHIAPMLLGQLIQRGRANRNDSDKARQPC